MNDKMKWTKTLKGFDYNSPGQVRYERHPG